MVVHRHSLRDTIARICRLLTHRQPGRDLAVSQRHDGMNAHHAPVSTIALLDGKGAQGESEADENSSGDAGNRARPHHP
jgi:hypothetical protein